MMRHFDSPAARVGGALLACALVGTFFQSWTVFWILSAMLAAAGLILSRRRLTTGRRP